MREVNYQLMTIEHRTSLASVQKPYLHEDIFVSAPWVVLFLALILVGTISYTFKNDNPSDFYFSSLINAIISSLIVVSCFSVALIRFLLYERSRLPSARLKASLLSTLLAIAFISLFVAFMELFSLPLALSYKTFYILFFVLFTSSLILFIIQSTLHHFPLLAALLFILLLLVPLTGFIGSELGGALGYIMGLALSQVLIFFVQWFLLSRQLGSELVLAGDFFSYLKMDVGSLLIGVFSAIGIFADKLISVGVGNSSSSLPSFQLTYNYNIAFSLAIVFLIPAFVFFIVAIEKDSYHRYRFFYECICYKKPLKELLEARDKLVHFLLRAMTLILAILIFTVFLATYFAPAIYTLLGLNYEDISLFRYSLWGNSLYVLFTIICILLYYFEFNFTVILLYGLFAFLNSLLSLLNMVWFHFHPMYIFPIVSLLVVMLAISLFAYYLNNLVEILFKRQELSLKLRRSHIEECRLILLKKDSQDE